MAPITFAQRGGRGGAPENTLAAFRRALELGATGLECDARLSADGEVVLVEPSAVRSGLRRTRVGAVPAARLAQVGVPRLADLYAEVGSDFELTVDLKEPEVAEPVLVVARAHGALHRLWLRSHDLDDLRRVQGADPDIAGGAGVSPGSSVRLVHSMGRRSYGDALEGHAAALARAGVTALCLPEAEWSLGLVALTHRFGLLAFASDAQEARRFRALLGMGIDAVYNDHVERMVGTVTEWSGPADPPAHPPAEGGP